LAAATTRRREIVAWCLYDFANSSYSAVIVGTIFQVYYQEVIVGNGGGLGTLWWGRALSLSALIVALSSPVVGGIADRAGLRKELWIGYTAVSVLGVAGFTLLRPGMILPGFTLLVLANVGMEGSLVFYNTYLTDLAPPSRQGRVSGWGFATGYAGSITALILVLPFVDPPGNAVWLIVAAQFGLFSLPAFLILRDDPRSGARLGAAAAQGLREVLHNLKVLWRNSDARRFLIAFIFYEDGVNTVIYFSAGFAAVEIGFQARELIGLFIVVQVAALAGAWALARPTDTYGPKPIIVGALIGWCSVTFVAFAVTTKIGFWMVAVAAGLGLGVVQAASRTLFATFIPKGQEAQYFGVYALVGKSAAVMGPILFGEVQRSFGGNQRPAILSVAVLFLIGLAMLAKVKPGRA